MKGTIYGLVVTLPEGAGIHYLLNADRITIGRSSENAVSLGWDTISGRHCELRRGREGFTIRDLGSTNGTRLNGVRIGEEAVALSTEDHVTLGTEVKARLVRLVEIRGSEGDEGVPAVGATRPLKKASRAPSINPVAAAMARAAKGRK